jgi:hypothetical protein
MIGKFVVFDVYKPGQSGGYLKDDTAVSSPRAFPLGLIRGVEPHPFAPNATKLTLGDDLTHSYVRGTFAEITARLNEEVSK